MAASDPDKTRFWRDVFGRDGGHTVDAALGSGPFALIVVGGGPFGAALAHHLLHTDQAKAHNGGGWQRRGRRTRHKDVPGAAGGCC